MISGKQDSQQTHLMNKKQPEQVSWSEEVEQVFLALKQMPTNSLVLQNHDYDRLFTMHTDVCETGLGTLLS